MEIYQKIDSKKIILDPNYQRRNIWGSDKQVAFIESLYMGIMIPPIYVVEIPGEDVLAENKYEVVDGKQRLSTIISFIKNEFKLQEKYLEYFGDLYSNKNFSEIKDNYPEETNEMLSSVLDIYVITANSPEFTKYDIFARLNKGAAPLKVNEIRRAVYHSNATSVISEYIERIINLENSDPEKIKYNQIFSSNDIKRFEDYGRFYKSLAFYKQSCLETMTVNNYNSRPREMINTFLEKLQKKEIVIEEKTIKDIINRTIELLIILKDEKNKEYLIDSLIPFVVDKWEEVEKEILNIKVDQNILNTLEKSPSTTTNVNERLRIINSIINK
ncbi:DUF262 domain-containing protein [Aliarcobacter butzleri]|uniref:DUF262 domain-containing protein n=1 Tax=Aliarcobacter butzleri TaxID=28197 RepID=UPI003AFA0760